MTGRRPRFHPLERYLVTVVIAAAVVWSVVLAVSRLDGENRTRNVELAFPEKRLLALTAQDPSAPETLLASGVTTLIRAPYTLESMIRYGLAEAWHPKPDRLEIRLADDRITSNATVYLTGQYGVSSLQIRLRSEPSPQYIMDIQLPQALPKIDPSRLILEISSGPMPAGFRRGLLLPAGDWGTTADLDQFTQAISSLRPDLVIPEWRGGINPASFYRSYFNTPWLRKPLMAVPEFGLPLAGRSVIRRHQGPRGVVRAHLAARRGIQGQSPERLRLRLLRAARERGCGLLYFDPPPGWNLARIAAFYRDLKGDLKRAGLQAGPADVTRVRRTGYLAMNVIYAGVAGLLLMFIWKAAFWAVGFTGREKAEAAENDDGVVVIHLKPAQFRWAAFYTAAGLMILHWQGSAAGSAKIAGLLIAVLAPLLVVAEHAERPAGQGGLARALWEAGKDFCEISLWSLAAGSAIAVLFYHPDFVQRLDGFFGVKLAYALPLFLITVYFFPDLLDFDHWRERWQRAPAGRKLLMIAGGLGVAAVAALLAMRLGNHPWLKVSAWELDLRDRLEVILGVRPRFKEFLIGHPLLILGLAGRRFSGAEGKSWPEWCIVAGSLGQLSIINTFCHVHTPLAVSAARSLHGLWMGAGLGVLLVLVAGRSMRKTDKTNFRESADEPAEKA